VRLETDGDRPRLCAGSAEVPGQITTCNSDQQCPAAAPLCVVFAGGPCTGQSCGTCVVSTGSCDEPECQNDGDCPDQSESCQSGSCQPVCQAGACPAACDLCAVQLNSASDRSPACGDSFILADQPKDCTTTADCVGSDFCIRISASSCTQSPCGECASAIGICAP
jgi:hypothetical protein